MPQSYSDLWTCPQCGQKFATKNMWHSCGSFSLEELFSKSDPVVRKTYDAFERAALEIAPFHVIPQKTRVTFQLRVRCCGGSPRKNLFLASFVLPAVIQSERISRVENYGVGQVVHFVPLSCPDEVDDEIKEWIGLSTQYGEQTRLKS